MPEDEATSRRDSAKEQATDGKIPLDWYERYGSEMGQDIAHVLVSEWPRTLESNQFKFFSNPRTRPMPSDFLDRSNQQPIESYVSLCDKACFMYTIESSEPDEQEVAEARRRLSIVTTTWTRVCCSNDKWDGRFPVARLGIIPGMGYDELIDRHIELYDHVEAKIREFNTLPEEDIQSLFARLSYHAPWYRYSCMVPTCRSAFIVVDQRAPRYDHSCPATLILTGATEKLQIAPESVNFNERRGSIFTQRRNNMATMKLESAVEMVLMLQRQEELVNPELRETNAKRMQAHFDHIAWQAEREVEIARDHGLEDARAPHAMFALQWALSNKK